MLRCVRHVFQVRRKKLQNHVEFLRMIIFVAPFIVGWLFMRQRKRSAASQKSRSWRGISITAVIRTLSLYKSYLFIYAAHLILLSRHFRSLVSWGSRIEFFDLSTTQANCPTWWYVHGKQLAGNSGNMARCFRCDADVWPQVSFRPCRFMSMYKGTEMRVIRSIHSFLCSRRLNQFSHLILTSH